MYYYKSERQAAYWALKELEMKLPDSPAKAADAPEWGTIIFRWPDPDEGGHRYAFQMIYPAIQPNGHWQPLYSIPSGTEEWAFAHNHPNNSYFSSTDTKTAKNRKTTMYMVNKTGGYWYDGREEHLSPSARHGLLWGRYPAK